MSRIGIAAAVLLLAPCALAAQEEAAPTPDTMRGGPSPRGALVRSLVIPGWGQASARAYLRGGIFFAAQSGSGFMVWKSHAMISEARDIRGRRADALRAADPAVTDSILRLDPYIAHQDNLIEARKEQREDWITWLIFWTFASGVDAYVAAQLSDFPTGLSVAPRDDGALAITATLRPRRRR